MTADRTRWGDVALGLALGVLAAYHQFKLPPVLPLLLDRHGYDRLLAGGFMSVYALAGLLLSAVLGLAVQRLGPRLMAVPVVGLFAAGALPALLAPENGVLVLVGRGVEGVAFTACAIAGPVMALGAAAPRHLPLVVGLYATWIPLGQLIALALAAPALAAGAWQMLWWLGLAATALLGAALWRFAGAAPAPPEARRQDPIEGRARRRALVLVAGIFALWSTQVFALLTWLPHYLVEVWRLDTADALLPYAVPPVLILIFNLVGGVLLRRGLPLGPLMAASLVLQAAVWLALPALDGVATGLAGLVLFGVGAGLTPACLFAAPNAIAGGGSGGGAAFGVIMTGRNLGVFVGPILLPLGLSTLGAWDLIGPIFGAIALLAALGALFLGFVLAALAKTRP